MEMPQQAPIIYSTHCWEGTRSRIPCNNKNVMNPTRVPILNIKYTSQLLLCIAESSLFSL